MVMSQNGADPQTWRFSSWFPFKDCQNDCALKTRHPEKKERRWLVRFLEDPKAARFPFVEARSSSADVRIIRANTGTLFSVADFCRGTLSQERAKGHWGT